MGSLELKQEIHLQCSLCKLPIREETVQEGALLLNVCIADGFINTNICPNCCQEVHRDCKRIEDVPKKWRDAVIRFYMRSVKTTNVTEWQEAKKRIKDKLAIMVY